MLGGRGADHGLHRGAVRVLAELPRGLAGLPGEVAEQVGFGLPVTVHDRRIQVRLRYAQDVFAAGRQAERGVVAAADHDAPGAQPVVQLGQVPGAVVAGAPLVRLGQAVPPQERLRPAELADPAQDGELLAQLPGPVQDRGAGQVQDQAVPGGHRRGELLAGLRPVGRAFLGVLAFVNDQRLRRGRGQRLDPAELPDPVRRAPGPGGQRSGPDYDDVGARRNRARDRADRLVDGQGGEEPADLGGPVQGQTRAADHHRRVGTVGGDGSQAGQGLAPAHVVADQHPAVRQGEPDHRILLRLQRRPAGQAGHRHRIGFERGAVGAVPVLPRDLGGDHLTGLLADLQAEPLRQLGQGGGRAECQPVDAGVPVPGGPAVVGVLERLVQGWVERGVDDDRLVPVVQADRWQGGRQPSPFGGNPGQRADLGGHLDLVCVGELDYGGDAGEGEDIGLGRAVVAAAGDGPARGDQVRIVREGQGDLTAVTVAAQVSPGLAVLLLAPVLRMLAGVPAGLLAPFGFQLVRACRAGKVVVADSGCGELAAVLAQHVPRGQRRVIGPQRRGHLGQDVTEPRVGSVESLRVV